MSEVDLGNAEIIEIKLRNGSRVLAHRHNRITSWHLTGREKACHTTEDLLATLTAQERATIQVIRELPAPTAEELVGHREAFEFYSLDDMMHTFVAHCRAGGRWHVTGDKREFWSVEDVCAAFGAHLPSIEPLQSRRAWERETEATSD